MLRRAENCRSGHIAAHQTFCSGILHFMTEEAAEFCRVTFGELDIIFVVTILAKFFGSFFSLGIDDIIELAMVVIIGDAAGRLRWRLQEESQDYDSYADQQEITFFKRKCHENLSLKSG
jgi:hypothetical protein